MGSQSRKLESQSDRGRFAGLRLKGTQSCRDPVGAAIRIQAGGREWTVQWTAGGGFEAASQSQVLIGLGRCEQIDALEVRWPNGDRQDFAKLPVDRELLLIQGRRRAVIRE